MGNSASSPASASPKHGAATSELSQPLPPAAHTTASSSTPSTPSPPQITTITATTTTTATETATTPPETSQTTRSESAKWHGTLPVLHNGALVVSLLAPIALLMPGRGRSMGTVQNALLGGGAYWGFNQLAHDYTGKSIWVRSNERWDSILGSSSKSSSSSSNSSSSNSKAGMFDPLPPAARERKAAMEAERARREAALPEAERARLEQLRRDKEAQRERERRGLFGRLWTTGEETPEWNQRRAEEDRKALESGKGIGDLMMDQIREVLEKPDQAGKKSGDGGQGGSEAQNKKP